MSLPVRECGLKYQNYCDRCGQKLVTPCAGVWIEILAVKNVRYLWKVTPCAGVWIEIAWRSQPPNRQIVTPCAGVWIEIGHERQRIDTIQSLPVRERGLKSGTQSNYGR